MKRMRKSKPTMAMYDFGPFACADCRKVVASIPDGVCSTCNYWRHAPPPLVPLGACPNVPSPCGHCWYCEQRKQVVAK